MEFNLFICVKRHTKPSKFAQNMCGKFHTLFLFKYIIFSLLIIKRSFNLIDTICHLFGLAKQIIRRKKSGQYFLIVVALNLIFLQFFHLQTVQFLVPVLCSHQIHSYFVIAVFFCVLSLFCV